MISEKIWDYLTGRQGTSEKGQQSHPIGMNDRPAPDAAAFARFPQRLDEFCSGARVNAKVVSDDPGARACRLHLPNILYSVDPELRA